MSICKYEVHIFKLYKHIFKQYTNYGFPVHSSTPRADFHIFPVQDFSSTEKVTFQVHFPVHFSLQYIPVHSSTAGHPVFRPVPIPLGLYQF